VLWQGLINGVFKLVGGCSCLIGNRSSASLIGPRMSDSESIKALARSVVSLSLLMGSSRYSLRCMYVLSLDSCADAARWAAVVTLVAGFYYLQLNIWCRCRRRQRGANVGDVLAEQTVYTDVPQTSSVSDASGERHGQQMTANHVYVFVYGWGLLLFAALYCMAGLHESSSCWWALGMFPLCFDELIMRDAKRIWVIAIGALLVVSVTTIWWLSGGEGAKDENFGVIIFSTVLPVMSPFIFFSIRSSVRVVTRDVWRLCELALPFMLLISLCVLTGSYMTESLRWKELQSVGATGQREAERNTTGGQFVETHSGFHFNHTKTASRVAWESEAQHRLYMCGILALTPLIAAWCIQVMVWSVVRGYATEFIAAFLLVLSVKNGVTSDHLGGSALAIGSAGTCFILICLMRTTI